MLLCDSSMDWLVGKTNKNEIVLKYFMYEKVFAAHIIYGVHCNVWILIDVSIISVPQKLKEYTNRLM